MLSSNTTPPLKKYFHEYAFSKESVCAFLYNPLNASLHKHCDFYEFSFVTFGSFSNCYYNQKSACPKNTLLFYSKGTEHSIQILQKNSVHFTFIVPAEYFESTFARFFPKRNADSLGKHRQIHLSECQGEYLTDLAKKLSNHSQRGFEDAYTNLFLFTVLSLCMIKENPTNTIPLSSKYYVNNLLIRLNNFTYINHAVNQIYPDYPIAQSALITQFKKLTGMTIVQYHNMKKMEYAAQLLSSHEYTITEVCTMLNFSSLPHFGQVFKAQFGVSPKEYQKTHFGTPIPVDPKDCK